MEIDQLRKNFDEQITATEKQIDELAKEVNQGWWKKNKERFVGKEGFESLNNAQN